MEVVISLYVTLLISVLSSFIVGGLVYGNSFGPGLQYHEWTSFISDDEFCFRACVGARATSLCNHIYDLMGCYWVRFFNTLPEVFVLLTHTLRIFLPTTTLSNSKIVMVMLRKSTNLQLQSSAQFIF